MSMTSMNNDIYQGFLLDEAAFEEFLSFPEIV